jgi:pentatricopeptide repeat protein
MKIMASANEGRFNNALHYCARMKVARVTPSISIYNALMSLAARDQTWLFAWAIFDDMIQSGIEPTTTTFTHLIQVLCLEYLSVVYV